jgi:hypothetical protein
VDFERAKFEIIQKSTKKFQRITNETKDAILKDIETFDFSKMIDEVVKNIIEGKFEPKDITSMMIVISELHQIYGTFTQKYLDELKKVLKESYIETSKGFKNDEEEEKKMNRRKVLTSLAIETYLYGIDNSFNSIKTIFSSIVSPKNTKEQFFTEFPMLVFIMKTYGFLLFKIKSKKFQEYIEKNNLVKEFEIETPHSDNLNKTFVEKLKEFYSKKILLYLEQEHKKLNELEEKNFENAGLNGNQNSNITQKANNANDANNTNQNNENNNDNSSKDTTVDIAQYTKCRSNYIKYIDLINKFANTMNFEVPELASEKTLRYENQKKAETRLEKINKYDPFSDEKEYKFYTINISTKLYEVYYTKPDDDKIPKKLDSLIEETLKCDTKETIDSISNSFLCNGKIITQKSKRLYLFEKILKDDRCNLENIKYFARLFKNISPIIKDLSDELVQFLIDSFHEYKPKQIYESNNNTNVNTGVLFSLCLKDIRFISEMVKFGAFPIKDVFDIIRDLLDDFKFKSIECLCQLLDNCGRYIYLNKASQERFGQLLDNIKKMAHNNLTHDDRAFKIITYSISICKPQEKSLIKKVKKRSIEEEYLRFLMNNCLNSEENSIKKVACLIRRFDWNKDENIIFKVILKYLLSSNEDKISNCCRMLYLLKNNHQKFFFNLINVILEEVRIGLERNDFNDNQHKLILSIIIGNFYLNKIINADLIFYILYMIVTFNPQWSMGVKELIIDNPLDSPFDTFRIQMILKILDICGKKLSQSKNKDNKENLNKFIEFLQMYILSKQYLSIEVENKIIACFDKLGGYTIYNDFSSALKNSSVYEGLGKEIDEELRQFEEKEAEKTKKVEKKEEKKEDKKLSEDMNEFKRDEDDEDIKIMNFDEELQKIISESLTKVQGASMSNSVINPLLDVKKKELNKNPPTGKMRLFTKNGNKIVITEIKKEDKKGENEEGEEDDIEDDEDYD